MQRVTILILWYTSIKRLRTPVLKKVSNSNRPAVCLSAINFQKTYKNIKNNIKNKNYFSKFHTITFFENRFLRSMSCNVGLGIFGVLVHGTEV
jgi:hypothetical protein